MKDVYGLIASKFFNLPYEDCLERKDDLPNTLGKLRRDTIKRIILKRYELKICFYNDPMWKLICTYFPVLENMPAITDPDLEEEFSLIDWLNKNVKF